MQIAGASGASDMSETTQTRTRGKGTGPRYSLDEFSDVVEAIYDCAMEPSRWRSTIVQIADLSKSSACTLHYLDSKTMQCVAVYNHGIDQHYQKLVSETYATLCPLYMPLFLRNVGDPATRAMLCDDDEYFGSRFYKEWVAPQMGRGDYVGYVGLRSGSRMVLSDHVRPESQPSYDEQDLELFRLLARHVSRSIAITDALDLRTLTSQMLEATLDSLVAGVYLVARDGAVVYMNVAAERQIKTGNALHVINNRLVPIDPEARTALAMAIDAMVRDEADTQSGNHSVAIPDVDGGYVATLLPLDRGRRQSIVTPFVASVAIFVQDPTQAPLIPGEAFAKLYGLTGGELRVVLALAQGLGGKEAADMLGLSEATVRTHLQRIFSKTGASRQADLLRLLQSSMPPVKPN